MPTYQTYDMYPDKARHTRIKPLSEPVDTNAAPRTLPAGLYRRVQVRALSPNTILALQRTAGNRAVQRLLASTPQPIPAPIQHPVPTAEAGQTHSPVLQRASAGEGVKAGTIQRLIAAPIRQLDVGRLVEIFNLNKKHPAEKIITLEKADLKTMGAKEKLYLVGHGYGPTGKYDDKAAGDLATALQNKGLRLDTRSIKLLSCQSGTNEGTSYAAELAKALGEKWEVRGLKGNAVTDEQGHTRAKTAYTTLLRAEYQDIFTKGDAEIKAAEPVATKAQADLQVSKPDQDQTIILKAATDVQQITAKVFALLYTFNKKMTMDKKTGEYIHPKVT